MVIVIPVCQPDACLADLVHQLRQKTDYPILVVDDGSSPDLSNSPLSCCGTKSPAAGDGR